MNIEKSPVYPVWKFMNKNLHVEDAYDDDNALSLLDSYDNLMFLAYEYDSGDDTITKIIDDAQELISEYSFIWATLNSDNHAICRSEPVQHRAQEVKEGLARKIGRKLLNYINKKNDEYMKEASVLDEFMDKVDQF